ncbi:hypothetical protein SNOG_14149 [Parastagonospora nodorum SN15]|uniref:Uncharacterized protein n=1 Tax=Phaeosphaeria nodorum (strain SN15 / ATCC MYA-4574 / FGSC 10173) TaxID=321614 RepID=Q0U1Y1_PHANO|nr:hypothetical protein SNOG_14149 [Parastagonospora nodorum SN15]EAT78386.1 hypothetical protein SNOG_14149 [Parastagonospora nodorum SN15]
MACLCDEGSSQIPRFENSQAQKPQTQLRCSDLYR